MPSADLFQAQGARSAQFYTSHSPAPLSPEAVRHAFAFASPLLTRRPSLSNSLTLSSAAQCQLWRSKYADIEKQVDQHMGVWARSGFSRFADVGRSISAFAGAMAGMLTFFVGPHHLILAVSVTTLVFAGSMLLGLVVELILKAWTYRKVTQSLREELRELCVQLNEREVKFGEKRTLEEKTLCNQANELWTGITFNGRTILRVLAANLADLHLAPLKPMRVAAPEDPVTGPLANKAQ